MNINKFSKLKSGQYKIVFEDDSSIVIHEDLILKYELLIKKQISHDLKEKILEENLNYIAYSLALKYISVRMRSVLEIKEYLNKKGVSDEIISQSIELLLKSGYLDDRKYANSFVNDKINLTMDGPFKVAREMEKRGVDTDIIDDTMIVFDFDLQLDKCQKIVSKLVKINRNKSEMMLKRKIIEYLNNLGYDNSVINAALSKIKISSDSDIARKEYDKIYKKLSRKYQGKELEYKVKQKMYALGFGNIEN